MDRDIYNYLSFDLNVKLTISVYQAYLKLLNNLEKRILQKYRVPTILENSRLGFIESVHES